jgi:hypothetical protein
MRLGDSPTTEGELRLAMVWLRTIGLGVVSSILAGEAKTSEDLLAESLLVALGVLVGEALENLTGEERIGDD